MSWGKEGCFVALCSLALIGCPDGKGQVLGSLSDDAPGVCLMSCQTPADCPAAPTGLPFSYVWLCDDGVCVDVECTIDEHCKGTDRLFGGADSVCRANFCTYSCTIDDDCGDDRDVCTNGFCVRTPEQPDPRCRSNADCTRACDDVPDVIDCYCASNGACSPVTSFFDPRCAAPSDCADRYGGLNPSAVSDADNWICTAEGACHWKGCNDTTECGLVETGATCDTTSGLCTLGCQTDTDCMQNEDLIPFFTGGQFFAFCDAGVCRVNDVCVTSGECTLDIGGVCTAEPGGTGFCTYSETSLCFSNADCPSWLICGRDNVCTSFTTLGDPGRSGGPCAEDSDCRARHLSQSLWNRAGVSFGTDVTATAFFWCPNACTDDASCGTGTVCVDLPRPNRFADPMTLQRRCLPTECSAAGGCESSLAACRDDSECPAPESCSWPMSTCPGVCLNLSCPDCATWLDVNTRHHCEVGATSTQVIRPD